MKVTIEEPSTCRRVLNVEVEQDVVDAEYDKVAGEYAAVVRVPGFRKGKAPKAIVEGRHTKQIVEETSNRLVPKSYREALEDKKIDPVAIVGIYDVSLAKGEGLKFRVEVDVAPKFKVPKYKGLAMKGKKVEVTDDQVDKALDSLRERSARYEDTTDRPVADGDMVQIDYTAVCEDKPLKEAVPDNASVGEGSDFWMIVGDTEFVPGMSAGISGAGVGESRDVDVTFPLDYRVSAVAGKSAVYSVTVKAIRAKVLPDLNDEFLKQLEVESEDALRSKLRESLVEAENAAEKRRLTNEITTKLLDKASFDVPESLVMNETRNTVNEIVSQNTARGVPREEIEKSRDEIVKSATESSKDRVRLNYILGRIAETEKITVEDAELDARIQLLAANYGMQKDALRQDLEKRNALDNLRASLQAEKTLDMVLDRAKVRVR